jgi:hypothetical protein
MKKLIPVIVCVSFMTQALAQKITRPYEYPVRPGTEEWRSAKTHNELREVNQIPTLIIRQMDTPTLILSVLKYPVIGDLLVYSTFREGRDQTANNLFAFDSLLNRVDLIEALIPIYVNYDPREVDSKNDPLEIGEFMLGLSLLEFIIQKAAITNRIDPIQRLLVQQELVLKYMQKQQSIERFGSLGLSTGVWALCGMVDNINISESWNSEFIELGFALDYDELDKIVNQIIEN